MKTLLSLVALLCLSSLALAIPDGDPDVMGVYFDPDFLIEETYAPMATPFMVYVVLLNPLQSEINGFEFGYDHWVPSGSEDLVIRLTTNFPPGIIIINPPIDPLVGSYSIGLPYPLPAQGAVVLLSWQYMLMTPGLVMHFHLTGADSTTIPGGLPGYWGPEGVSPAGYAETCFGTGARANEFCPLPVEPLSWGSLKGLFR